jgi:hypothetical protein
MVMNGDVEVYYEHVKDSCWEWDGKCWDDDHDSATHLGLSRIRILMMFSGCKSAIVWDYIGLFL